MQLLSPAFQNNAPIPREYTCDGKDTSPPLAISGVPTAAKSLVIILDDPDAPRGDFVHWLVWNIDPKTTEIAVDSVPAGAAQGTTDFGRANYGGPCPPSGTHHYQFKLYALDIMLDLPPSSRKTDLERAMSGHIIAATHFVGTYARE